jgi:hypothetical protein
MPIPIEMNYMAPRADQARPPPVFSEQDMRTRESDYYKSILPYLHYPAFAPRPEESDIYVFDTTPEAKAYSFTNSELFESHIANAPKPDARVVSICCRNSLRPLGITEHALISLMNQYDIDSSFFELALSFGYPPQNSEAGFGGMTVKQRRNGAYGTILFFFFFFRLQYVTYAYLRLLTLYRYALSLHLCRR